MTYADDEFNEIIGSKLLQDNLNNKMNNVQTDVTFMSLALADFALAGTQLVAHDYYVAGGLAVLGVLLVACYHKFGTQ